MNYFITFRCYGTWLHGDERGSVDRLHNQPGEPLLESDTKLQNFRRRLMKSQAVQLDEACRRCVAETLSEVANHRQWTLLALNVLSNHVHVVISTPDEVRPEKVLSDFKAWTTRRLREQRLMPDGAPLWEHHGSTRYLNDKEAVYAACHYVLHCQDEPGTHEPQS